MKNIAIIGCGAIAQAVLGLLRNDPGVRVTQVVVPEPFIADARAFCADAAAAAQVGTKLDASGPARPDLLVECAGHAAIAEHVLPALRVGIPSVVVSIGALHEGDALAQLAAAAEAGARRENLSISKHVA